MLETFDNQDVGAYVITIDNELLVPADATKADTIDYSVQYSFTVFIQPCAVNDYAPSQQIGTISYAFGAPSLTSGSY